MFDLTISNLGDYCNFFVLKGNPIIKRFSTLTKDDIIKVKDGFYFPNLVDIEFPDRTFEKCLMSMTYDVSSDFIDGFFQYHIRKEIIEETNNNRLRYHCGEILYTTSTFIIHDINRPNYSKLKLKE